ncbi:TetR/AcrR family transcriptional regulator [Nocardia arthritidis]|uniref:TetR/AcrR family transcriptional regulator n=1 Tax=Nocardia arthritidis TaxID=228602 RepID=A0A6G9YR06_9NOCA|nr:TetR/AcrR family transcriptional regulator [Nocardia arthritidis]QIS15735.1 TetR/AcrR family transcriptional regulator [Nocardia arthritidis]
METSDQRLLRGMRSRQVVTARAVDIASIDGLENLSFGRLADDLGLSKAGIQTLFRTKEKLQLATIEAAERAFVDAVVLPARRRPRGLAQLRALIEQWLDYVGEPLFAGGCFWGANLPEFDSKPGPVRDALVAQRRRWLDIIAAELKQAVANREIAPIDIDLTAFQINAVLTAANIELRLGDTAAVSMVHRAIDAILARRTESHVHA